MGGTIQVESKVGEGTRFTIHISFRIASEDQIIRKQERSISEITEKLKGKRILLAEDNELNAEIAETVLSDAGLEVIRVEDGIMCVAELQKKPDQYFDVILMDVQMPNMDGYTATKMIRNLNSPKSHIPIIAMTANAYDEDRRKAHKSGMNGFLAKPLNVDEMIRELGKILKV